MRRFSYISACILICLAACQESVIETPRNGAPIYLAASVNNQVLTRAPYMPLDDSGNMIQAPSSKYPLKTDVWGSTTPYFFTEIFDADNKPLDGSRENGEVAIHTDATFMSGDPQLLRAAIYNKSAKPVYFVAFSPMSDDSEAWSTDDGTQASFVFSGNDDVMFAPQVQGKYALDYSQSPLLHFRHLLTWLRVEFRAESMEVSESWGAITSMKIRSKNKVTVDLSESADKTGEGAAALYEFDSPDNISFTTTEVGLDHIDMSFYCTTEEDSFEGSQVTLEKKFTDQKFPVDGQLIPYLTTEELAYVLCAPVVGKETIVVGGIDVAAPEYYIDLVTENRTVTIPVDLKINADELFLESTRGKQFTLTLNFKMGNTVYLSTSVNDWKVGGLVVGGIGDSDLNEN